MQPQAAYLAEVKKIWTCFCLAERWTLSHVFVRLLDNHIHTYKYTLAHSLIHEHNPHHVRQSFLLMQFSQFFLFLLLRCHYCCCCQFIAFVWLYVTYAFLCVFVCKLSVCITCIWINDTQTHNRAWIRIHQYPNTCKYS